MNNKTRTKLIIWVCIFIIFWLFFLTYFIVPFSKLLCQDTGPNGLYGLLVELKGKFIFFSIFVDFLINLKNSIFFFVFTSNPTDQLLGGGNQLTKELRFINVSIVFKVNDLMPLNFRSTVVQHRILVGRPELLFCNVSNYSNSDQIFTSIYNVYPAEVLPYLEKIQCFCYDDQIIESNSTLHLPVYYKLNDNFKKDPLVQNVTDIIISYSIFKS